MLGDVKSLLKIGITNSVQSITPILVWILLGMLFKDSSYSNGFIITYPYQFLSSLLFNIVFKAQLKSEVKNKRDNHNGAYTGLKILYLIFSVIFALSTIFVKDIFGVLHIGLENKNIFLFGISQMFMDWIIYGITTAMQYDNKNMNAFSLVVFWYVSKVFCIIVLGANTNKPVNTLIFTSLYMFIIMVFLIVKLCKQETVIFSLIDGIKYSLYDIPSDIGMVVVYVFSIGSMSITSTVVLSAYNLMSMCTDNQWDILLSATDTVGTLKVKTGEFRESSKRLFCSAAIYSAILFLICIISIGVCYLIPTYRNSIDFGMVRVMFLLECFGFPLYGVRYMMSSWVAIEHPNGYTFLVSTITYTIRFITVYLVKSIYNVSIGVVVACLISNTFHIFIYYMYSKHDKVNTRL